MAEANTEVVEGIEADPAIVAAGEYDSALGSDIESTGSASITSSIVRQFRMSTLSYLNNMLIFHQPCRLGTNTRTAVDVRKLMV